MASRGVNKWIGIGNCCADPETRYMPSGGAVTNITIACGDSYKDKNTGEMVDKTEFVRLVFFNRIGEIASQFLKKGSKIFCEGRIQTRKWQDQSGQDRYSTEIVVNEMQMLDSRNNSAAQPAPQQQNQPSAQPAQTGGQSSGQGQPADDFDDDIPYISSSFCVDNNKGWWA